MVTAPNEVWVPAAPNNYGTGGLKKQGFILHWMAGYLPGTDAIFRNPNTGYCTNYGIGSRDGKGNGLEVHRYTPDDSYRAYGSYNADADNRGLSIEIENNYWAGYASTPTDEVHELVAQFMAAKADALGLGKLVLGDFPDHRYYLKPIPGFGTDFNVTTHRSMALKDCPGTTRVQWLVDRANQLRGRSFVAGSSAVAVDPFKKARESENEMYVRLNPDVYGAAAARTVYEKWRNPATGKREFYWISEPNDAAAAANLAIPCDAETLFRMGQKAGYVFGDTDPDVLTARAE